MGRLAVGLLLLVAGCVFAVTGAGFLVWALHSYLLQTMSPAAAGAIIGLAAFGAAGGLLWTARSRMR